MGVFKMRIEKSPWSHWASRLSRGQIEKKYCQSIAKARRTVKEPRNTSLVLIRCDGSYEATLLSPGSHAFRCCKQGLYKQNISRKVHTLLVVDENGDKNPLLLQASRGQQLKWSQSHSSRSKWSQTQRSCTCFTKWLDPIDSRTTSWILESYTVQKSNVTHSLLTCCLLCTIQINATGTVHVQKDKCRYT